MPEFLFHVLGGGIGQRPLVRKAKAMGLRVLVTDMYPNPPCREEADIFFQVNTVDKERTLQVAKEHGIQAIATDETDVALPTVAFVAEAMGLPGIGYECALRFTNKFHMRRALKEICPANIPEFRAFQDVAEATEYVARQTEKLIVKPVNSQGSRGVAAIEPGISAQTPLLEAFDHSRGEGVLVERFIAGQEVAVESVVVEGEPRTLAVSRKDHYPANDAIDMRVCFPAGLPGDVEDRLLQLNATVIRGLGLPYGLTHAEYLIRDGQPWVVEIAARGAGSGVSSHIVPYVSGVDTTTTVIEFALGRSPQLAIEDFRNKHALLEFFDFAPGRVKAVHVDDEARKQALVFELNLNPGDVIRGPFDSRFRPGYYIVVASTEGMIERKRSLLRDGVRITYE